MSQVCCPSCRLRFTASAAAYVKACPQCGNPPQTVSIAEATLGFRLFAHGDAVEALPEAVAVALPVPRTEPS